MPRRKPGREARKTVVVMGGGVAGLTAAHELAARGHAVQVITPRLDRLGGITRSRAVERAQVHPFGRARLAIAARAQLPRAQESCWFPPEAPHLWELLGAIPWPGRPGKTVRDQVTAGPPIAGGSPLLFPARPDSPQALLETLLRFAGDHALQDAQTFALRLVRYLLSCPGRRAELHGLTIEQYLHGQGAGRGALGYSPPFEEQLRRFPRLLDALDPTRADARTVLNVYLQRLLRQARPGPAAGGTLPAPPAEGWFGPWRRHLEGKLGVQFLAGRLQRLELRGGGVRAVVRGGRRLQAIADRADYLVVATDPATAEQACEALPRAGVPGQLHGFTGPTAQRWQARTRVMFFFGEAIDGAQPILPGSAHLAAQRLTGVWSRPLDLRRDGYASAVIVDRYAPRGPFSARTSAAGLSRLAGGLWRQLDEVRTGAGARSLPQPIWFAVLEGGATPPAIVQVPVAGDWAGRPGSEPGTTQPVLHDRLVFAGAYLKTFTRVPSAEAACESGRHAANAILDHARARDRRASIWDPEQHEAPELQPARAMDQWCFERQLPHPFEIAGLDGLVGAFSWSGILSPLVAPLLRPLIDRLVSIIRGGNGPAQATPASQQESLLLMLRNMRMSFEEQLARNRSPAAAE